ncbi:sterol desaturase family protein [Pseudoduganella eburnea]|uniref:Sterol desaturase family protein n=1 Tax=Massilia eburnea TaxID=1776165 RepID=A0A6L6QE21_9BURK|nr:sterol desaturase family protein [Massilia eburnea]MTW10612.1 sterol desaturase family protein [Massilia eburnea]
MFKTLGARYFLPAGLMLSVGSFLGAKTFGIDLELAVVVPNVLILIAAAFAERYLPYRIGWTANQGDLRADVTSATLLFAVIDPLLKWMLPVVLLAVVGPSVQAAGSALFPIEWPFLAQVVLAAAIAEFTSYWSHRLHHRLPALWWLHALHHSSERLYWLNNFRIHPLNYGINYVLGFAPLLLIGTPNDVIFGYLALTYPVLMLQHANLPLRSGWLNYVFSTNEVHRWHHADNAKEGDRNFGRALVMWDIVFGTFRYSPKENDPVAVGLYQPSQYPARSSFVQQVLSMFMPGCCRAAL